MPDLQLKSSCFLPTDVVLSDSVHCLNSSSATACRDNNPQNRFMRHACPRKEPGNSPTAVEGVSIFLTRQGRN